MVADRRSQGAAYARPTMQAKAPRSKRARGWGQERGQGRGPRSGRARATATWLAACDGSAPWRPLVALPLGGGHRHGSWPQSLHLCGRLYGRLGGEAIVADCAPTASPVRPPRARPGRRSPRGPRSAAVSHPQWARGSTCRHRKGGGEERRKEADTHHGRIPLLLWRGRHGKPPAQPQDSSTPPARP